MTAKIVKKEDKHKSYLSLKPYLEKDEYLNKAFSPLFQQFTPIQIYQCIDSLIIKSEYQTGGKMQQEVFTTLFELRSNYLSLVAHLEGWTALQYGTKETMIPNLIIFISNIEVVRNLEDLFLVWGQCEGYHVELEGTELAIYTALKRAYFVHYILHEHLNIVDVFLPK